MARATPQPVLLSDFLPTGAAARLVEALEAGVVGGIGALLPIAEERFDDDGNDGSEEEGPEGSELRGAVAGRPRSVSPYSVVRCGQVSGCSIHCGLFTLSIGVGPFLKQTGDRGRGSMLLFGTLPCWSPRPRRHPDGWGLDPAASTTPPSPARAAPEPKLVMT
jgi:hypothetical protein